MRGAIVIDDAGGASHGRAKPPNCRREYAGLSRTDHRDKLMLPGFIDAHLHFPQYRMIAAYGADLLDWLNRYTFVEEQRYGDRQSPRTLPRHFLMN